MKDKKKKKDSQLQTVEQLETIESEKTEINNFKSTIEENPLEVVNKDEVKIVNESVIIDKISSSNEFPSHEVSEKTSVFSTIEEPQEKKNEKISTPVFNAKEIKENSIKERKSKKNKNSIFDETKTESESEIEDDKFYKVVFIDEGKQREIYTQYVLIISNKQNVLIVKNPFEKITLTENILNKKILSLPCKLDLQIDILHIPLNVGVLIKTCKKEKWMNVFKHNAERIFNERVLNTYRELTSKSKSSTVIEKKSGLIAF